ncbi:MAG: glycosyltransferase [Anaerolineae bacterium]|nr:glycosyltransferase [Anaerolineae bacterium]
MTQKVGHFIVTYNRPSWLYNQIVPLERYTNRVYAWTRTLNDDITRSSGFIQLAPNFGTTHLARRVTLGLAVGAERTFGGMSRAFARDLQANQVNIIHAHFGRAGVLALPAVQKTRLPLITSFYGYDISQYGQRADWKHKYQELFSVSSAILCLGTRMRQVVTALGCPEQKAHIHHLGVDIREIEYHSRAWDGRHPLRVLIAAAFRPKKGIPVGLKALARLSEILPVQITIIGDALDVPDSVVEKQRILSEIDQLGLKSITTLMGAQPYKTLLEQAYNHHVFLAPSITAPDGDTEGTPMVLADMAATGIPIVSTDHADIPELIVDKETGLLADEGNVDSLLDRLVWLTEHQSDWERMTRAGRQHIEAEFSRSTQARRMESLYDRTIASR